MKTLETIRQGGKRIFEDLKLPDAEKLNVKAQIAYRICGLIQKRKLTQPEAASLLGTDHPRVSALLRGATGGILVGPTLSIPQCAGPGNRDCHPPDQKAHSGT
jgi:predicted XRE-type DNA-binding protein